MDLAESLFLLVIITYLVALISLAIAFDDKAAENNQYCDNACVSQKFHRTKNICWCEQTVDGVLTATTVVIP